MTAPVEQDSRATAQRAPQGVAHRQCGNGLLDIGESCDDANRDGGDGCDSACVVEDGFVCGSGAPTTCDTICGDGLSLGDEACDDANSVPGDGCSQCQVELGYSCTQGEDASTCAPICGDGIVLARAGEQCDDNNMNPGDGCSAVCSAEPGYCCDPTEGYCIQKETFEVVDVVLPIIDGAYDGTLESMTCIEVNVTSPGLCNHGRVQQIRVELALEHPRAGGLTIKMISPHATVTTLASIPGYEELVDGAPARVGYAAPLVASAPIRFDHLEQGAVDAEGMGFGLLDGEAVCAGDGRCAFLPSPGAGEGSEGLEDFYGDVAGGAWKICVGDSRPSADFDPNDGAFGVEPIGALESVRLIYRAM